MGMVSFTVAELDADETSPTVDINGGDFDDGYTLDCSSAILMITGGTGAVSCNVQAANDINNTLATMTGPDGTLWNSLAKGAYKMPGSPAKMAVTMSSHTAGTTTVRIVNATRSKLD